MLADEFLKLMEDAKKRYHVIGHPENGVIAALDMEGRLFTALNGRIVSRVNPKAIESYSTRKQYLNPGGDGLWPAPEGTCFGYEYPTGEWRVPPSLTNASYLVTEHGRNNASIQAEVDLINNQGRGIPAIFTRNISVVQSNSGISVNVTESIKYIGTEKLSADDILLTPWTLCQFDCGPGCEVVFSEVDKSFIRDLYEPSEDQRFVGNGIWHVKTDATQTFQIGLDENVPWIEFRNPEQELTVRRKAEPIPVGQNYIDIADAPPSQKPDPRGVRYSVYCDAEGFMEVEAAGGCPDVFEPGAEMVLGVETEYSPGKK